MVCLWAELRCGTCQSKSHIHQVWQTQQSQSSDIDRAVKIGYVILADAVRAIQCNGWSCQRKIQRPKSCNHERCAKSCNHHRKSSCSKHCLFPPWYILRQIKSSKLGLQCFVRYKQNYVLGLLTSCCQGRANNGWLFTLADNLVADQVSTTWTMWIDE